MMLLEDFQACMWLKLLQEEDAFNISSLLLDRVTKGRTLFRMICALSNSFVSDFVFAFDDKLDGILGNSVLNYLKNLNISSVKFHQNDLFSDI